MEIHQLRYFCAIATYGTFTRAAKSEHVAQPSLSQQILKLEEELGGRLFDRLPRMAQLTPLGEFFLPHALAILQKIRECKAVAQEMKLASQSQRQRSFTVMPESAAIAQRNSLPAQSVLRAFRKGA